jgi:hypothetical protein
MRWSLRTLLGIYYAAALALIGAGAVLWATGHGTGDPYLTIGVALALVPVVVIWIRKWLGRG